MGQFDDEIAADYRGEQAYHDAQCRTPFPADGKISRFLRGYDYEEDCDVVYVDRTTGAVVLRYDAGDPANTRFDYGAMTDKDCLAKKGLDISEMIDPSKAAFSDEELRQRFFRPGNDDYHDVYDDYYEPDYPDDYDWGDE